MLHYLKAMVHHFQTVSSIAGVSGLLTAIPALEG